MGTNHMDAIEEELWALHEAGDLDDQDLLADDLDDDMISAAEEGFVRGYQRERDRLFREGAFGAV